jgi:hypothetical protein
MHTKLLSENLKEETTWVPRCRWEDNIRVDLREKGWESVDWIYLAQDRVQRRAQTFKFHKHGEFLD